MNRNMAQLRTALQPADNGPAVEYRQMQIEQDGIRLVGMGEGKALVALESHNGLEASAPRKIKQDRGELGILLNDQEQGITALQIIPVIIHLRILKKLRIGNRDVGNKGFAE
ncbi:hypothetical protein D3C80_1767180 [compost metagenome]